MRIRRDARASLVARILDGDGTAKAAQRRAAFEHAGLEAPLDALIGKVARHAHRVTDEDVAAARSAGWSEDQIFELVVCAAIGAATRQTDAALVALDAATSKE